MIRGPSLECTVMPLPQPPVSQVGLISMIFDYFFMVSAWAAVSRLPVFMTIIMWKIMLMYKMLAECRSERWIGSIMCTRVASKIWLGRGDKTRTHLRHVKLTLEPFPFPLREKYKVKLVSKHQKPFLNLLIYRLVIDVLVFTCFSKWNLIIAKYEKVVKDNVQSVTHFLARRHLYVCGC